MIGIFWSNTSNQVAFSFLNDERRIKDMMYSADAQMVTFRLDDGSEELMTSEIEGPVHEAIMASDILHVGNITTDQKVTAEYEAKIIHI